LQGPYADESLDLAQQRLWRFAGHGLTRTDASTNSSASEARTGREMC
jgi:hypothetical protein